MKRSRLVLAAALALIGLPAILVPIDAISYYAHHRSSGAIVSSGLTREYVLFVPKSYDRSRPTPLVISMHGAALGGAAHRDISQWNAVAERDGVIVVYPSGFGRNGPRIWRMSAETGAPRDVTFISDLIDTLRAEYNIDPARIYADGLSNGGGMAFVLSCTLSDRIAAVGMVNAAHLLPWEWCTDRRPVPMIAFHGTADPVVPYRGGRTWVAPRAFPDQLAWTANWARRNRCAPDPVEATVSDTVTSRTYTGCADDATVALYTIQGGGHDWPGGGPLPAWLTGPPSRGIDATRAMWAFFRDRRLRQ
jgi:polyhydroxybutyrate depolymerase